MSKIFIDLAENSYDVFIGNNIAKRIISVLNKKEKVSKILLVVDKKFYELYKNTFVEQLIESVNKNTFVYKFNATEKNKNYESIIKIHEFMQKKKFGRDSLVISLGGGITGDVAGFAASIYMRGVPYVQIPTTLLSAVDSSVGGKTGINFNSAKNFIGSFYQPENVFIDTSFFSTLSQDDLLCGVGEILKYGYLTNEKFFKYLKRNHNKLLELNSTVVNKVVNESVKFKAGVVMADEKETGIRKCLNFGHTFAHAIETAQSHKIQHGQAVIVGMLAALHLSKQMGLISDDNFMEYASLLMPYAEFIKLKAAEPETIYKAMSGDKKNRSGKIKFVLIKEPGEVILDFESPKKNVIEAIEFSLQYFS